MKTYMVKNTKQKLTTLMAAILLCSVSSPLYAQTADAAKAKEMSESGPVDQRISDLHKKLKITADQEKLWETVAQEMRDSGKNFNEATRSREQNSKSMTAIDDLNSYADITAMHAESMKKFVSVFKPLYDSMSEDQKKNADEIFRGHKSAKKKMGAK